MNVPCYILAVSSEGKYCYNTVTCGGGHPDTMEGITSFGQCCEHGGRSWGLSDGHSLSTCQPCPTDGDFETGDPDQMLKPSSELNTVF